MAAPPSEQRALKTHPGPPKDGILVAELRGMLEPKKERQKPEIVTGTLVGDYRVGPLIAFGHHARLFAAEDRRGRPAILKLLRPTVRDHCAFRELLVRESCRAARLDHPNIERFYARGELAGEPYYAVEMVAGLSLLELAEELAFDPWVDASAIELGRSLFSALAHAHERGIVHGAISDDVIRIAPSGKIVLTRFGVPPLRCSQRREALELTQVAPDRMDPRAQRTARAAADDVRDAARIVRARLKPSTGDRTLRMILDAALSPRAVDRPRAQELADVFRLSSTGPVPEGFADETAIDPTQLLPRRRALPRPPSVTQLMRAPVTTQVQLAAEPLRAETAVIEACLFAVLLAATCVAGMWVAG